MRWGSHNTERKYGETRGSWLSSSLSDFCRCCCSADDCIAQYNALRKGQNVGGKGRKLPKNPHATPNSGTKTAVNPPTPPTTAAAAAAKTTTNAAKPWSSEEQVP